MQRLARDVGINVLANLIAAAIIYLLGVWAGLFPGPRLAVGLALLCFLGAILIGAVALARSTQRSRLVGLAVMLIGGCFASLMVYGIISGIADDQWGISGLVILVLVVLFFLVTSALILARVL